MSSLPKEMDESSTNTSGKNHKKYRKDKPWDTEDIDHWKQEEWDPSCLKAPFLGIYDLSYVPASISLSILHHIKLYYIILYHTITYYVRAHRSELGAKS